MNSSPTIISEPDPTEVMPTMMPPTMPRLTSSSGRGSTSVTNAVRPWPPRRSSRNLSAMAPAPTSSAVPSATSMLCCADFESPINRRR
jgi:hypothetical protein